MFYQLVEKLYYIGEISFKNILIDGTKIEANTIRHTFVWANAVEKNLQKLRIKINQELALHRDYEKLYSYLERLDNYNQSLEICGRRKSYSKTDTYVTFMRMKEDHMLNGQLKPGYNVQIGEESEYIVGLELFRNPTDTSTLIPFLERRRKNTGRKYENIKAEAGYASEENYTYL